VVGRRVFFSFHYGGDVWRASSIRKSGQFDAVAAAGWNDASLWEEAKKTGDAEIRRLIDCGLTGTSVTAVVIGAETASRKWVKYEIEKSIERGNGLLGVRIHNCKNEHGQKGKRGAVPKALTDGGYHVYDWDSSNLGRWVELAALDAKKSCLKHDAKGCWRCRFLLRWW
jgi:hypothetical protein